MKKKETLWELLKRLDEEAGQFNVHFSEANRYYDMASAKTKKILDDHEKQIHKTVNKIRRVLKTLVKK
jgi:hypothetical protein